MEDLDDALRKRKRLLIFFLLIPVPFFLFREVFNFFPSPQWMKMAVVFSLVLSLVLLTLIWTTPMPDTFSSRVITNMVKIFLALIYSLFFYNSITCGLGFILTAPSSTTIERDIVGIKIHDHTDGRYSSIDYYYIDTPDLPQGVYSKLYITENEFDSIPHEVHMHVTLKQSFFGMAVKHYTFTK